MTIKQFLIRIKYTYECPWNLSAGRWAGMLKWYYSRIEHMEEWFFDD